MSDKSEWKIEREGLHTRSSVQREFEKARESDCSVINLEQVEFVSGATADELVYQSNQHDFELINRQEMVEDMIGIIHERQQNNA